MSSPMIPLTPQGNMPAIGIPDSQDYPRLIFSAPYFEQIPIAEIIQPSVTEAVENILPSLVPQYVDAAAQAAVQNLAVLLTGSTMSGPLFLSPLMPTQPSQAATMAYVDSMIATAGIPEVPPVPSGQVWARETGQWVPITPQTGVFLPLAGGSMTGNINMSGNTIQNMAAVPAMPNGAAPAQWVLNQIASVSLYQGTWDADNNTPDLTQLSTHVNAYTWIATTTSPSGVVIGPAIPGLQGLTVFNGDTIIYSTVQGQFMSIHAGGITLPEADGRYVQLAGSQMSGALLLNANATQPLQAVTLQQLDTYVPPGSVTEAPNDGQLYGRNGLTASWSPVLPLAGGILTGALTLSGNATANLNPVPLQQMTSAISGATAGLLPLAGGTMTGLMTLSGNASVSLNPVPLQQLNSMLGAYLPLNGGTLTGPLNLPAGTSTAPSLNIAGAGGFFNNSGNLATSGGFSVGGALGVVANSTFVGAVGMDSTLTVTGGITGGGIASTGSMATVGNLVVGPSNQTQVGVNGVYYGNFGGTPEFIGFLPAAGALQAFGNGTFLGNIALAGSDPRWKENIGPVEVDCLGVVNEIALSSFDMLPHGAGAGGNHWDVGFLSTQLAEVIPLAVIKGDGDKTWDTLDLLPLCAYLVGAVQELAKRVEALA